MTIDWQEWRDHFLLHSLENVEDVLYFWKHSTVRRGWLSQPGSQAFFPLPWGPSSGLLGAWRGWVRSWEQPKDETAPLFLHSRIGGLGTNPLGEVFYLIGALQTCRGASGSRLWGLRA